MKITYSILVTVLLGLVWFPFAAGKVGYKHSSGTYVLKLYVSTKGNDAWSGRRAVPDRQRSDGPLATLDRARDVVREWRVKHPGIKGDIIVELQEGTYEVSSTFKLDARDSGAGDESRVLYVGKRKKKVTLLAGKVIRNWRRITDNAILRLLDPDARDKIRESSLKDLGIEDFGSPLGGGMELFFNDKPMWISRDPNQGFVRINKLLNGDPFNRKGVIGDSKGRFVYNDKRVNAWAEENDAFVLGYWCYDWSEEGQRIAKIDTLNKILEVRPPYHKYGYRLNQWFYGFNLLYQMDEPGEYYIDREKGILYFYPPGDVNGADTYVSVQPAIMNLSGVSNVTIRRLTFEGCRKTAVYMENCTNSLIAECTIKNTGGWGILIREGRNNGVVGCDIYETGAGGINLKAGNRTTLVPANNYVDNNYIHHIARIKRTYNPGITINGVGNRATHNLICHVPHMAMGFSGNDQLLEFNEIYDACFESNDAGAIYAGFNLTMRGNVIRNNYLHDMSGFEGKGCVGIYLDDMFSSAKIEGNIFKNVTRAAMIGGGRDNEIVNNIFVDCVPALHVDARGLSWFGYHVDDWLKEAKEFGTFSGRDTAISFNKEPYRTRYPNLVNFLNDEPRAPKGNVISNNICVGGVWDKKKGYWHESIDSVARRYLTMNNNIVSPQSAVEDKESPSFLITDPKFVDGENPENGKFKLKSKSPALSRGFKMIPFEKIGLYKDKYRLNIIK